MTNRDRTVFKKPRGSLEPWTSWASPTARGCACCATCCSAKAPSPSWWASPSAGSKRRGDESSKTQNSKTTRRRARVRTLAETKTTFMSCARYRLRCSCCVPASCSRSARTNCGAWTASKAPRRRRSGSRCSACGARARSSCTSAGTSARRAGAAPPRVPPRVTTTRNGRLASKRVRVGGYCVGGSSPRRRRRRPSSRTARWISGKPPRTES